VIIYCLDNSSFSQADGDGVISQIEKLKDNKYHVVGELIVAHEITMAAAVANLKRILAVCGDRKVFIITPLLRYINIACCDEIGHCTHRQVPDSALKLHLDLVRLHKFIEGRLSSHPQCEIIPTGDLLAAKHGASPSEILAAYSGWGAVHGSGGSYTRMALTLVDKVMRGTFKQQQPSTAASEGGGKRKRAESGSFSGGSNHFLPSRRHKSMDSQPVFSRGGFRGGSRGGKSGFNDSRGGRRSSDSSGHSGDKRYYKSGDRDRASGGGSGGWSGSGGSGYSSRY
jgi:hypothetical protein